ncbi:hypothetical protein ABPG72_021229 [Tetrahymena utriculariae]
MNIIQNENIMKQSKKTENSKQEETNYNKITYDIEVIQQLKQKYIFTGEKELIEQILKNIYELPRWVEGVEIDQNWLNFLNKNCSQENERQYQQYIFWSICLQRIFKKIAHIKDNKNDYDRNNIETINKYFECIKQIIMQGKIKDESHSDVQIQKEQNIYEFEKLTKNQIDELKFIFQKKQKKILGIQTSSGIRDASLLKDPKQCGFLVKSKKFRDGKQYKWQKPFDFIFETLELYYENEKQKDHSEKRKTKDKFSKDQEIQSSLKWVGKESYRILIKEQDKDQDCSYIYLPDKYAQQVKSYLIYQKATLSLKFNNNQSLNQLFENTAFQFKQKVINQWYYNYMNNYCQEITKLQKTKYDTEKEQKSKQQEKIIKKETIQKEIFFNYQMNDKDKETKNDKKQLQIIQLQKQENEEKRANSIFKSDGQIISLREIGLQEEEQLNQIDFEKLQRLREEQEWYMTNKQALQVQQNLKVFQQTSQFAQNLADDLINENQYKFQQEQVQIEKNAIQVLQFEIFSPNQAEILKRNFYLQYQYSCIEGESQKVLKLDEQYQIEDSQVHFYKKEDCFYKYTLLNNNPFCISQEIFHKRSENDLDIDDNIFSLEICIKSEEQNDNQSESPKDDQSEGKKDDQNWGIYKLGFNEHLKNVEGNDHWLICQLQNSLGYAFLHLIIFDKQNKTYFEYLQNLKKNQLFFQCPFYNDCINLPYYQPGQILLVYNLLSVFEYEKNFLDQYKYDELEYEQRTQQDIKPVSQCYADIRTLYYFMYKSQVSKYMAYLTFQQQIWLKFEDKLYESNKNEGKGSCIYDFYEMCREGVPVENRFSIWFNNSSLFKKVRDIVLALNDFCSDIFLHLNDNVQEIQSIIKENCPSEIYSMEKGQIQEEINKLFFSKRDKVYRIISELSHSSCVHMVPQMLLDLNMKFKSQLISKVQLSSRYNQIVQIIKDIILVGTLDCESNQVEQQQKASLKQISIIIYNQGLIDIVDKLITLNKKHKPNKYLQEYKIQSDIFWTLYCFYKDCLKFYINSEYKARQIINDLFVLNYCFKTFILDLWDYLDSLYINTDFLFEKAFLSMFANLFSRELLYRIWDIIFLEIFREKIKPSWILISIAITILHNLKEILLKATSIDDVIIIIRNYCNFETNYNEFINKIYFWIDQIFYQHNEGSESDVFDDQYLTEKIQIQADSLEQFNTIQKDQNLKQKQSKEKKAYCLDDQDEKNFQKIKSIPFSILYKKYEDMKQNLQELFEEKKVHKDFKDFEQIYGVLTNQPYYVHVVVHSFTKKLAEKSEMQFIYKTSLDADKPKVICYESKKKKDEENWIQFQIDTKKFKENETLGKVTILINETNQETQKTNTILDRNNNKNKKQYKGYIEVDNLLYDQVVKLNIQMQERIIKANQTYYIPTGFVLECSVIVQTCHSYDIISSFSKRVSFYYLKNIGKKITEDQKSPNFIVYKHQLNKETQIEYQYNPFYPNILFEKELQTNIYKSKLDFYNVDMINQWKINSFIPQNISKIIIEKILPQKFNLNEQEQLIKNLTSQNNQFFLLDLFLICIIYSQESFPSKASLIFKYLNLFERRRSQKTILDITVKSFLIGFYDRIKYYFPSHHVIAIENYFKSKAVSQINKVVFVFDKTSQQQIDLTEFFKQEIFDKVFEKNLFLHLDLSNPDLLKLLYFKFFQEKKIFSQEKKFCDGKLIIDYQQKSFQRQKKIKLTVDEQKQTFIIKKSLPEKLRAHMSLKDKKQELFQRLLKLQKYQINFEVYDTYTEQEFVDLLNQMPLVPLLLTVKNTYQITPLSVERDTRNLSINLNLQLQVKIQVDKEFQYQNKAIFVRDIFFKPREKNIYYNNQELQIYLPSINCYSRIENIANSILSALVLDNKIRAIVFDRGNGVKIHSENYLKFDYEIFVEENPNKKINFPKQNSFYDYDKFQKHMKLSNLMIYQNKQNSQENQNSIYTLIINISTQQRNIGQTQNCPTYFCSYKNQNIDEQSVYLPVVHIQKRQDQKYIVKLQSLHNQQYIVKEKELYCILDTDETSGEYFIKSFDNYSNI